MDPTSSTASSNVMVAMGVTMITIIVSYWDVIAKIKNPFLFWTIIGAAAGQLVHTFGSAVIRRDVIKDYDFPKLVYRGTWLSAGQIFCLACLQFHTSYRGMLILFPRSNRTWVVPSIVTALHIALQIAGLYYYYENFKLNFFFKTTQEVFVFSVVTTVYVSVVETIFYLISQYKIITTLTELSSIKVSFVDVLKMILRSACYIAAVIMLFCSSGQFFFSVQTECSSTKARTSWSSSSSPTAPECASSWPTTLAAAGARQGRESSPPTTAKAECRAALRC
ncbi:hypothetical protein DFJ73DRAFT_810684, partial [Zopfochytrium polystomum]